MASSFGDVRRTQWPRACERTTSTDSERRPNDEMPSSPKAMLDMHGTARIEFRERPAWVTSAERACEARMCRGEPWTRCPRVKEQIDAHSTLASARVGVHASTGLQAAPRRSAQLGQIAAAQSGSGWSIGPVPVCAPGSFPAMSPNESGTTKSWLDRLRAR